MNRTAMEPRATMDVDAELAYATMKAQVERACEGASPRARQVGQRAITAFREALRASAKRPAADEWERFFGTVSHLVRELDQCASFADRSSHEARAALGRLVEENYDLIEPRTA